MHSKPSLAGARGIIGDRSPVFVTGRWPRSCSSLSPVVCLGKAVFLLVQSLVVWRHLVLNVSDERHSHLSTVVAPESVAHKMRLDLHLQLFRMTLARQRTSSAPDRVWSRCGSKCCEGWLTISRAPRRTPHSMLEYQSSSCARLS